MEHNYHLDEIKEDTKIRFSPYFNHDNIDININKDSNIFEINIKIIFNPDKFKEELKNLQQKDNKYREVDIDRIIDQINFLTPALTGYINLEDKESHINIVKVGLFSSTSGNFTKIEREFIKYALSGQGIGSLLVLMFIYFCYSFNNYNVSDKIENISLDDSSDYPGWYKKLLFEYPDDDEVANLDLTSENFEKLQNKIFQYSNKSNDSKLHIFNTNKLLSDVAISEGPMRKQKTIRKSTPYSRGGTQKKKNKKNKKNKKTKKRNKKTKNKKNKKRLISKRF